MRAAAYYPAECIVAVYGIWGNEDQNLAWVRFGLRALTRTRVVSKITLLILRWALFDARASIDQLARLQPAGRLLVI